MGERPPADRKVRTVATLDDFDVWESELRKQYGATLALRVEGLAVNDPTVERTVETGSKVGYPQGLPIQWPAEDRTCGHCGEPESAHCQGCGVCVGFECPEWCESRIEY